MLKQLTVVQCPEQWGACFLFRRNIILAKISKANIKRYRSDKKVIHCSFTRLPSHTWSSTFKLAYLIRINYHRWQLWDTVRWEKWSRRLTPVITRTYQLAWRVIINVEMSLHGTWLYSPPYPNKAQNRVPDFVMLFAWRNSSMRFRCCAHHRGTDVFIITQRVPVFTVLC